MERTKSIERVNLPDGKYYGDWCAYYITIKLPDWKDRPIKVNIVCTKQKRYNYQNQIMLPKN